MSRRPRLPRPSDTRCLPISSFQCPCSRFRTPPRGAVFSSKAGAKIQPFSFPPKIFFAFSAKFFALRCAAVSCDANFFSCGAGSGPQNGLQKGLGAAFSGGGRECFCGNSYILLWYSRIRHFRTLGGGNGSLEGEAWATIPLRGGARPRRRGRCRSGPALVAGAGGNS